MKHLKNLGLVTSMIVASLASTNLAADREHLSIVGSSTVFPFSTTVAERFGKASDYRTPIVESTGSGGGFKLFCRGVGEDTPDITNASRRIKASEVELCAKNGVEGIVEAKIGYDGIVLANSIEADTMNLSLKDIFLALAKEVPGEQEGELIDNPYLYWADINPDFPKIRIEVLGPPPTSGTRDAFVELAMEGGCRKIDWIKELGSTNKSRYKEICHTIREDGAFIEAGENDNLIVRKLEANPESFGIFGFSFLEQNGSVVQGSLIDGVAPEFEAISDGSYPVSRALWFYVKKAHVGVIPGIKAYLEAFTDGNAWGEEGYLTEKGLIPLPEVERAEWKKKILNLRSL